jgi:glycosyltransferase involved in cell wall biosynthesis
MHDSSARPLTEAAGGTSRPATVSVVVPCYRYGHFLPECIGSILGQAGVEVRVLVIDDASPDDSAEVATALAEHDPRIEVLRHRQNKGHLRTYNEGLDWATGDYVALVSADDLLTPGALARATGLMTTLPGVGFVYGHSIRFQDGSPLPPARDGRVRWQVWPGHEWVRGRFDRAANVISSPEVVVRTELQRRVGGYSLRLPHSGDLEMWLRLAAEADVGYLRGADQAYYRIHPASMFRSRYDSKLVDLRERRKAFAVFLEEHGALPGVDQMQRAAMRKLAWEALWLACRAYDRRRTDAIDVDELVDFAHDTMPDCDRLLVHTGLRWRRRLGAGVTPYLQPLGLPAVTRMLQSRLWWHTWRWRGV